MTEWLLAEFSGVPGLLDLSIRSAVEHPLSRREVVSAKEPSAERHLDAVAKFIKAGFDHIILVQIGPDQDYFLDLFKRELDPALRRGKPTRR